MPDTFEKDPQAVLDYVFDFKPLAHARPGYTSNYLTTGETVDSYTVTVPAGLTLDSSTEADGAITAWLSSGVAGASYTVSCRITTSAGRVDERSITVAVRDQ